MKHVGPAGQPGGVARARATLAAALAVAAWAVTLVPAETRATPASPSRPVHTYSIVARDSVTGDLGVAVQSHYFSVGSVVPWAESGVGAVATQSIVEPAYGPKGLALMRGGMSAPAALDSLLRADSASDVRQVGMVDAQGRAASHTGEHCIPDAGSYVGSNFAAQANLMVNDRIWGAMANGFKTTQGDLAERMLAALDSAQAAGGDIRGMQSAALIVVRAKPSGQPWADRIFDLRVEDSDDPLGELHRLVRLGRAYNRETDGDNLIAAKRPVEAGRAYGDAMALAPESDELIFWAAVSMWTNGDTLGAKPLFKRLFFRDRNWVNVLPRLVPAGLFPDDPAQLAAITVLAPSAKSWHYRAAKRSSSSSSKAHVRAGRKGHSHGRKATLSRHAKSTRTGATKHKSGASTKKKATTKKASHGATNHGKAKKK